MFPTSDEVRRGLAAILPLFTFKDSGLGLLPNDRWTAWRSFLAGGLAFPPFIVFVLTMEREQPQEPLGFHFLAVWLLAYVLLWTALPLIVWEVGRSKPFAPRLAHFIAAYNWLLLPIAYLRFIVSIMPEPLDSFLTLILVSYVFALKWFLARKSLDIGAWGATAVVALSLFLSLNIVNLAISLTRLDPRMPN